MSPAFRAKMCWIAIFSIDNIFFLKLNILMYAFSKILMFWSYPILHVCVFAAMPFEATQDSYAGSLISSEKWKWIWKSLSFIKMVLTSTKVSPVFFLHSQILKCYFFRPPWKSKFSGNFSNTFLKLMEKLIVKWCRTFMP